MTQTAQYNDYAITSEQIKQFETQFSQMFVTLLSFKDINIEGGPGQYFICILFNLYIYV